MEGLALLAGFILGGITAEIYGRYTNAPKRDKNGRFVKKDKKD